MGIRKIKLSSEIYKPGEILSQESGYAHITISYDITGDRYKIDRHLKSQLENYKGCLLIDCVNTTIYMQEYISVDNETNDENEESIDELLRKKLLNLFVNEDDLSNEKVTAYCMVGNFRAFAYELDA
ncbi:hypothetical protein [Aeromonas veronii]|uniref:hypothetical protein n=1 Tax=Aeromonas veronii TaxID=654 RepID=UPI002B484EB5|nr:hypothetical protein [Aeromonas veronii]